MIKELSIVDYAILIGVIVLVIISIRMVKVLVVQDFYRSWEHLIRPALMVLLIVSIFYGYNKTKRVWDNLAYINNYQPGSTKKAWALSDKFSTKSDQSKLYFQQLMAHRKAWPVALIEPYQDTTTVTIHLNDNDDPLILKSITNTYWKEGNWSDTTQFVASLEAFEIIDSLYDEIGKLNRNVLLLDSVYSMKIKTWLVTDSLRVQFIEGNEVMDSPESPMLTP